MQLRAAPYRPPLFPSVRVVSPIRAARRSFIGKLLTTATTKTAAPHTHGVRRYSITACTSFACELDHTRRDIRATFCSGRAKTNKNPDPFESLGTKIIAPGNPRFYSLTAAAYPIFSLFLPTILGVRLLFAQRLKFRSTQRRVFFFF